LSVTGLTINLGATPHDGTSTDRVINMVGAKDFANNTVNTTYVPPGSQKLQIYLTGLTGSSSGNTYNYVGAVNPYTVTGP
jgi:hypothetical protein